MNFKNRDTATKDLSPENSLPDSGKRIQKCAFCGNFLRGFSYQCKFCGNLFCSKHRLPEIHVCNSRYRKVELEYTRQQATRQSLVSQQFDKVKWEDLRDILEKLGKKYAGKDWHLFTVYNLDASDKAALKLASRHLNSEFSNTSAEFCFQLGRICHKTQMFEEAKPFYEATIQRNPKMVAAFNNLGLLHKSLGNLNDAEAIFRDAISSNKNSNILWINLGLILEEQGQKQDAISAYNEALLLFPNDFIIWKLLERLNAKEYYLQFHGFDIKAQRQNLPWDPEGLRYEVFFNLNSDPLLMNAGITIGARIDAGKPNPLGDWETQLEQGRKTRNRIVFKRNNQESLVHCVHTAIFQMSGEDLSKVEDLDERALIDRAVSSENHEVDLSPEEHFVSLKSFVAGIAEEGIQNMMLASYDSEEINPFTLPFGFNDQLQAQIVRALRALAPEATTQLLRDHLISIAKQVPGDWYISRLQLFADIFFQPDFQERPLLDFETIMKINYEPLEKLYDLIFGDAETFKILDEILKSKKFRQLATRYRQQINKKNDTRSLPLFRDFI